MNFAVKFSSYVLGSGALGTVIFTTSHLKKSSFADCKKWDYNWDGKQEQKSSGTRNILLIRHGQYNTAGVTDAEKMLTSHGRNQAQLVGKYIAEFSNNLQIPITRIVSSDMTRAMETCTIAMKEFPMDVPAPSYTHLIAEGPPHAFDPPHRTYTPSIDEIEKNQQRLDDGFGEYFGRSDTEEKTLEVYFCHANVIRYYLCKILQLPLNAWLRFNLKHCSVTWITIRGNGKVSCQAYGDSGFMPVEMVTFQ